MKENFEKRRLVGNLSVSCKYDDGSVRKWEDRKEVVVARIQEIVTYYESLGYKLTLRQLHYQFVSRNWIVNHDTAYKKLGKILDDCRYCGLVDWNSVEDRGRVSFLPYYVFDIPDALNDTIENYRLDRQDDQNTHIEVWTEKDALSGIMKRSTSKYGVRLVVNKGYTSSSAIYSAYERLAKQLGYRKVVILYFGDHDPSGLDMVRDIRERLEFMFQNGQRQPAYENNRFKVIPIGLTMKQIEEFDLPPNPTKLTDSRSEKYIEEFGETCWEVDALKPEVLTEIVEKNINDNMDNNLFQKKLEQEKSDKAILKTFIDEYNSRDLEK